MAPLDGTAAYERAGPTLLAAQPLTPTDQLPRPNDDWDTVFQHLEGRLRQLKNWRYSWWSHWSRLAQFFLPRRYTWVVTANRYSKGGAINDQIVDSTATQSVQICASGLWTGLTSPSRPWFKLGSALPWVALDQSGKSWLEDTEQRIYTVLGQSNFYDTMAQAFQDVVVFGTSPVIIYEDAEDLIRCYLPCAGEYFLAVGCRFSVDTLYREFVLTVAQIVEMFNVDNCPEEVQKLWGQGGSSIDTEFVVAHAIEPNFAIAKKGQRRATVSPVPGSFVYREVYWVRGNKTAGPLSVRGFHERPFMVARWSTVSNDPYGRSPCMDALGDQVQIQHETRRKGEVIEKIARPPMGADVDMKNEPASLIPGGVTYTNTAGGKKGFWPLYEVNPQAVPALTADIEKVSDRIKSALFVDIFMAITQMDGVQPRNELELTKRDLERLQVLGPFVEKFETEFAGPAIERTLDILRRRGMLKPLPASLANVPLKIDYVSIMKLAQRSAQTVAMKDFAATMGALSSVAKAAAVPDPLRCVNLDDFARRYADLSNIDPALLFTAAEVAQHDEARQKAVANAQVPGQAMAAVQAARTLSQTPTGPGTALSALTGSPAGAPGA